MAINSKKKGARGEREFSRLCWEHGYDVRRTAQYCGKTGEAADVVGLPGIHVEVKRVERLELYSAMFQAIRDSRPGEKPIVAHKRNNEIWYITMRADDWFELYREWEAGRETP